MESKQSFIPKKSFAKPIYQNKGFGLLLGFSIFLLVVSGLVFTGAYFYKKSLQNRVNVLSESLKRAQAGFEPSLITELSNTADRIESSKVLLSQHKSLTPIFEFLEQNTLENVRFSSFDFSFSEDGEPTVSMKGSAMSYSSLALQVEEFQKDKNVKTISVSGLSLGEGGVINFNIEVVFIDNFIKYRI